MPYRTTIGGTVFVNLIQLIKFYKENPKLLKR
ncbi:hypothetical protein SAMN05216338_104017 [Bradyrhizobium sp. Rc2d]|nr:hypothetical protein SAMN05216338_104017 [Bradyrhizobium sp. Rc2d]